MSADVKPIPDGYTAVTPYLIVDGCAEAIEFYKKAFGAEEIMRLPMPDGSKIMHAEIQIGGARIMMGEASPEWGFKSPKELGGTPVSVHIYTEDADALFDQAVAAGAEAAMPVTEMFWGDRFGKVMDPYGHMWSVATHVADPTPEEMQAGFEKSLAEGCS